LAWVGLRLRLLVLVLIIGIVVGRLLGRGRRRIVLRDCLRRSIAGRFGQANTKQGHRSQQGKEDEPVQTLHESIRLRNNQ